MKLDARSIRELLADGSRRARFIPLLVCRVALGWEFIVSGWLKLHKLGETAQFFATLHIPAPGFNAALVAWTELICGGLLLLGLASRLAAFPLIITMIVAIITAKRPEIHGLSDLFFQVEMAYICMLVVIIVLGPGAASADGAIAGAIDRARQARPPSRRAHAFAT